MLVNGKKLYYFNCTKGVCHGDPLSPLLFCIAEDVLNRSIVRLVDTGKLMDITDQIGILIPSHVIFVDDIMVFYI